MESAACSFAHGYEDLQFQHKFNEANISSYAQFADPSAPKTNPFKEPVSLIEERPHQLAKTTMCKFHARNRCREGRNCQFAHNVDELCRAPDLTKTSLCKAWKMGCCPMESAACSFAHGYEDLQFQHKFNEANISSYAQFADPSAPKTDPFKELVSLLEEWPHKIFSITEMGDALMQIIDSPCIEEDPAISIQIEKKLLQAGPVYYLD